MKEWVRPERLIFLGVLAVCAVYVFSLIDRGWIPHDDGTLAHAADRVLQGELPHADFDDMYTGGQAFYHAAVFRYMGTHLLALRLSLFGAFVGTLPVLWYVATRFARPVAAGTAVILAVAWSVPVYPAAMPSWYNLFLAIWTTAAALRYLETDRLRWLAVAGFLVGVSITIKVVGLYLLAALLLFAVHREQTLSIRAGSTDAGKDAGNVFGAGRGPAVVITGSLVLFVVLVVVVVQRLPGPATAFHFLLPPTLLAGWLIYQEWSFVPVRPDRFRRLFGMVLPILGGTLLPLVVLIVPYALDGSVYELARGVFLDPMERFDFAVRSPPNPLQAIPLILLGGTAVWTARSGARARGILVGVTNVLLLAVLLLSDRTSVYQGAWWLIRPTVPLLVVGGLIVLSRWRSQRLETPRPGPSREIETPYGSDDESDQTRKSRPNEELFLLTAVTALVSLVQFPNSAPVYFFYVAPLAALLGLAIAAGIPRPPWMLAGVVAGFHVCFAVFWIHTGWVYQMGERYAAHPPTEVLALERGGIRVVPSEKKEMEQLAALLEVAAPEPYIWATPDAPEVYFLTEKKSPTSTLFDFFEDEAGRNDRILRILDRRDVGAVVLNTSPTAFSRLPEMSTQRTIASRFPRMIRLGRFFVRLRPDG